jgi:hypothetical protein
MPFSKDDRSERDFYKKPGGGLIDPQGEPPIDDQPIDDRNAGTARRPHGPAKKDEQQRLP